MMDKEKNIGDSSVISEIKENVKENFFVEAGAGSGKTWNLTQRMLSMVGSGIDVSKICAITYTNAAANEFYGRFHDLLVEKLGEDIEPDKKKLYKDALDNIDLCFMGTIDSFCRMILSEHPNEGGIPASTEILSKAQLNGRFTAEYHDILNNKHDDPELLQKAKLFEMYTRKYKREEIFKKLYEILNEHREDKIEYWTPLGDPDKSFATEYALLNKLCKLVESHPSLVSDGNAFVRNAQAFILDNNYLLNGKLSENFNDCIELVDNFGLLRLEKLLADMVNTAVQGVYPGEKDLFVEHFSKRGTKDDYYVVSPTVFNKIFGVFAKERFGAAVDFVLATIKKISKELRGEGKLSFFDYKLYLRNMLKEDSKNGGKLIGYIRDRYEYYLLDEFQDTNPLQAEIIFYLTADKPKENWFDCEPKKGRLFIVGDPKQSIYSFSGADVRSYMRVRELFENEKVGKVIKLRENHRSSPELCEWFNKVFVNLMPSDSGNNSKFEAIPVDKTREADIKEKGLTGVYYYRTFDKEKSWFTERGEGDIDKLPEVIKRLMGNDIKVLHKDEKEARKIEYNDIMIIVGNTYHVASYLKVLTEHNIPVMAEGKVVFDRCKPLKELSKAVNAMANPVDAAAMFALLRSPLIGIGEKEIIKFRNDGAWISLYEYINWKREQKKKEEEKKDAAKKADDKKPDTKKAADKDPGKAFDKNPNVKNAMEKIYNTYVKVTAMSPVAAVGYVAQNLELFKHCDATMLEYYCYAMELLRSAEKKGEINTLQDVAELLRSLIDGTVSKERCLSLQKDLKRVRLANLHKIKGLQAPVVILAAPNNKKYDPASYLDRTDDEVKFTPLDVQVEGAFGKTESAMKANQYDSAIKNAEKDMDAEHLRKLYVAATRAERLLIIAECSEKKTKKKGKTETTELVSNNWLYWSDLAKYCPEDKDFFECFDEPKNPDEELETVDSVQLIDGATPSGTGENAESRKGSYHIRRPSEKPVANNTTKQDDNANINVVANDVAVGATVAEKKADGNTAANGVQADYTEAEEKALKKLKLDIPANVMGTMVHRLMEILVSSGASADCDETVEEIIYDYWHEDKAVSDKLKSVFETMKSGKGYEQDNKQERNLLAVLAGAKCFCELPFCTYEKKDGEADTLINGVMDLVYQKDDEWYIVDYKTNANGKGLDEKYRTQLEAYEKALEKLVGKKPKGSYIYHIDLTI